MRKREGRVKKGKECVRERERGSILTMQFCVGVMGVTFEKSRLGSNAVKRCYDRAANNGKSLICLIQDCRQVCHVKVEPITWICAVQIC